MKALTTSIALCTYNGEKYLRPQLDSILAQSVVPDEIIVCDDISKDSTVEILEEYRAKYPQIKIFVNTENLGFIKNFEKAISLCTQDIILICDQDDTWEADKVQSVLSFFRENPDFDGVFHDMNLMEDGVIKDSYLNWKQIDRQEIITDIKEGSLFSATVSKGSFILGCALSIRRESLKKYNIRNFPYAHDLFIAQKLSAHHKLGFIPRTLSSYRLHDNQVYGLRYKSAAKESEVLSEIQQYFKNKVWGHLSIVKKYEEMVPEQNVQTTAIFKKFIHHRNEYLQMMGFVERKIYIAKCARYHYLFLNWIDLIKL